MKLAQIILPLRDNNGESLTWQHAQLRHDLREAWGGYTAVDAEGSWANEGRIMTEPVIVYHIAMERQDVIRLRELAASVAQAARQECVMIVTPCGDVEFVKPGEK